MALKRMVIDGFGQLELNQVAFPRDGRIEAQCALDDTDFADIPAENGMLLAVDRVNRKIKFAVDDSMPIALNYTTEHMYDERARGLKNFKLERGTFLPRMGFLSTGELFTTNCIAFDDSEFADAEALEEAAEALKDTKLYGGICENGAIKVSATKPEVGPVLIVAESTTMPDGQFALKFQVLKA
jgi:hypothetical protein